MSAFRLTANEVILASTAIAGSLAIIGTFLGGWVQRAWTHKDEAARREAVREDSHGARVDDVCRDLLRQASSTRTILKGMDNDNEIPLTVHAITEEIDVSALQLPDPLDREEISRLATMVMWAESLAQRDGEMEHAHQIAWDVTNRIQDIAGALIRGEAVPAKPDWYPARLTEVELLDGPDYEGDPEPSRISESADSGQSTALPSTQPPDVQPP